MRTERFEGALLSILVIFSIAQALTGLASAAAQDGQVGWDGVYYDSRDSYYRSPLGESISFWGITADVVRPDDNVTFRIRVFKGDVTSVRMWIWRPEIWHLWDNRFMDMTKVAEDDVYEWWEYMLPAPGYETIAYYFFRIEDSPDVDFYADDENRDGGAGKMYDNFIEAASHGYLLLYRYPEVPPAVYGVRVSIWPWCQSGKPGTTLVYTVTVWNVGAADDVYTLTVADTAGWSPTIEPSSLAVAAGASENATLSVTIPENVEPYMRWDNICDNRWDNMYWENFRDNFPTCAVDIIKVTAASLTDNAVRSSAICVAHVTPTKLYLRNLYEVGLDANLWLENGSKLVARFYTWAGDYDNESVIWSATAPFPFVHLENVPHPLGKAVERLALVIVDERGNMSRTVASFTVTSGVLLRRVSTIKSEWPYARVDGRRTIVNEISRIKSMWPYAPPKAVGIEGVELTISVPKTEFRRGEIIDVSLVVRNHRTENVTFRFNSGYQYDFIVYDENLSKRWRWSDDKAFIMALTSFTLEPRGSREWVWKWDQRLYDRSTGKYFYLDPGIYFLRGVLVGYMETPFIKIVIL